MPQTLKTVSDAAAGGQLSVRDQAIRAAAAGLDFLLRHQVRNGDSADSGRFPFIYDCEKQQITCLTTNWTTGIGISALLAGFAAFGNEAYRDAAGRAVNYLRSLQQLDAADSRVCGVFREVTPQSGMAHPRDALTAAWAMADWSQFRGDEDALNRAKIYANWFVRVGLEKGYPYWTVRIDGQPWEPSWCGSFHSGSAFFMYRMHQLTGKSVFRDAMRTILDFYNEHHLAADGHVTVIVDRTSLEPLDGKADARFSNRGWEMMHVYNDDFGALANLAAWTVEGQDCYLQAAKRFLTRMLREQREDGGFGPADHSVPSAGGAVLLELLEMQRLGFALANQQQLERIVLYLINLQVTRPGEADDGGFRGYTGGYTLNPNTLNIRAGAYAILALLRYAGSDGGTYRIT